MEFGLKENIIEQINSVFEKFPQIEEVVIYGSRAKGNYREGSDIDFTLKGKNLSHKLLNSISLKLDELFLPYVIDISNFNKISNGNLIEHINRVGKVFYEEK
ncbi:MAG: nucleotidyltransferase domain-containing protein [bacterium]